VAQEHFAGQEQQRPGGQDQGGKHAVEVVRVVVHGPTSALRTGGGRSAWLTRCTNESTGSLRAESSGCGANPRTQVGSSSGATVTHSRTVRARSPCPAAS